MFVFVFFSLSVPFVLCVVSLSCLCCVVRDWTVGALILELNQMEGCIGIFSAIAFETFFSDYG